MYILCVSATPFEIIPFTNFLNEVGKKEKPDLFILKSIKIQVLVTGVGMMQTAFHLGQVLLKNNISLVINLGVAGAFDRQLELGEVVEVISERIGDSGAEEANAEFLDIKELGLNSDSPVFNEYGLLTNPHSQSFSFLKKVNGLTVNKVHGAANSIRKIMKKYPEVQVESMEGAAIFYACLNESIPFLQIRAISNYVEPRNRDNWQLSKAIDNLNGVGIEIIKSLLDKY